MSSVEERIEKLEKTVSKLAKAVKKLLEEKESETKQVKANGQRLEIASMTFSIKKSKYENKVLLVITAGKQSIYRPLSYSELKRISEFFANLEVEETNSNSNRTAKRKSRAKRKKLSEATE